jgi:hypothetical protein
MFELKETQNNQGHSLNLQYIPAVPLRVAVGGKLFILYISYHFTLLGNCQVWIFPALPFADWLDLICNELIKFSSVSDEHSSDVRRIKKKTKKEDPRMVVRK